VGHGAGANQLMAMVSYYKSLIVNRFLAKKFELGLPGSTSVCNKKLCNEHKIFRIWLELFNDKWSLAIFNILLTGVLHCIQEIRKRNENF